MAERAQELAATQVGTCRGRAAGAAGPGARRPVDGALRRRPRVLPPPPRVPRRHAGREPELAERFGTRSAAMREAIAAYIADYQEEEGIEAPFPPADLALMLRALGIGLAIEALVSPEAVRDEPLRRLRRAAGEDDARARRRRCLYRPRRTVPRKAKARR